MEMKQTKIQLDEKILEKLQLRAEKLGMKTGSYIQMILGQHVADGVLEDDTAE